MRRGDRESWSASIDISNVMHVALYVRDACQLEVAIANLPPPLDGGVVDHSGALDAGRRRAAGSQWPSWWEEILRLEGAKALGTLRLPDGADRMAAMSAVHDRLFDWPRAELLRIREAGDVADLGTEDCGGHLAHPLVQSSDYRDAKLRTIADALPELVGPGAPQLDLRFRDADGVDQPGAQLLMVSHNRYQLDPRGAEGTRGGIDRGVLCILALGIVGAPFDRTRKWTSSTFRVDSGTAVEVGIDGKAQLLDPPLLFASLPSALRVRTPRARGGGATGMASLGLRSSEDPDAAGPRRRAFRCPSASRLECLLQLPRDLVGRRLDRALHDLGRSCERLFHPLLDGGLAHYGETGLLGSQRLRCLVELPAREGPTSECVWDHPHPRTVLPSDDVRLTALLGEDGPVVVADHRVLV